MSRLRPSALGSWPVPFDPATELDWGDPVMSRRLLLEHLDQRHDGATRRVALVERHVARLRRLLPPPPADVLDAACGPGLYAVRLAQAGYRVTGVDVGAAVLDHARTEARRAGVTARFQRADLRRLDATERHDAVVLIYFVLEGFRRPDQVRVLRNLAAAVRPGGRVIVELRVRPDQPPGRLSAWEVVPRSLLGDRPHLLLTETTYDARANVYVLREVAVLDDGTVTAQQTTGRLVTLDEVPRLFERAGLRVDAVYDGWSRERATPLSPSLLVVAERPGSVAAGGRQAGAATVPAGPETRRRGPARPRGGRRHGPPGGARGGSEMPAD